MVRRKLSRKQKEGLGVLALAALWLYASLEHGLGIPCPFKWATDIPCPGCGMGRACLHLSQGHWHQAWLLHPASYLIPLYFFYQWILPKRARQAVDERFSKRHQHFFWLILLALLLLRWAWKLFRLSE